MKITELTLYTDRLEPAKQFYTNVMELELLAEEADSFTVTVGWTALRFAAVRDQSRPFYHMAFNIPENKIEEAREWLSQRVELVLHEEDPLIYFESWNAHSLYFTDAAGNLIELIARHNLENATDIPFSSRDFLCVSEIGLPVEDVLGTVEDLGIGLGIGPWRGPTASFTPMGDEDGLLILVAFGRTWFMSDVQARFHPAEVTIHGNRDQDVHLRGYEFHMIAADGYV
ncbi:VOC family protein [Brevibacillus fluminis]|uniref:VOC family protein n=1 Tax=Brevibacillus fluminis TaxID=511487 RepID=UPI003F88D7ED